jgi:hypothetical protein
MRFTESGKDYSPRKFLFIIFATIFIISIFIIISLMYRGVRCLPPERSSVLVELVHLCSCNSKKFFVDVPSTWSISPVFFGVDVVDGVGEIVLDEPVERILQIFIQRRRSARFSSK